MDSRGNLHIERDGEPEQIIPADNLQDQFIALAEELTKIGKLQIDITDAPPGRVKALIAQCKRQGYVATRGLRMVEGKFYLYLRRR